MTARRISRRINKPENNDPSVLEEEGMISGFLSRAISQNSRKFFSQSSLRQVPDHIPMELDYVVMRIVMVSGGRYKPGAILATDRLVYSC
jgi:hypothetical protein